MAKRSRPGRDFEELVARIERALAPHGAIIKSPDYVKDLITGRMREVDASIRITRGGDSHLITVECRDHRKGKQDDRWIEQLVTKREKIGATRTVAVSSTGFSDSAIATARAYGIELRRYDQITDVEIAQEWARGLELSVIVTSFLPLGITLLDRAGVLIEAVEFPRELRDALAADLLDTEFLRKRGEAEGLSAHDVAAMAGVPQELREGGPPVRAAAVLDFHTDEWYIATAEGDRSLSQVSVLFEFRQYRVPAPVRSVGQYSSPDQPLMELVEGAGDDGEMSYRVSAQVNTNRPLPARRREGMDQGPSRPP